nr:hypothetical protein [Tanacetum cinerariifolium]
MFEVFKRYGHVDEVFIAEKRNVQGKRFRFATFMGVRDPTSFEKELSTICIGTQKFSLATIQNTLVKIKQTRKQLQPEQLYATSPTPSPSFSTSSAIVLKLKSIDGAANTHNIFLDEVDIMVGKNLVPIKVLETGDEIDSLFNGYHITSSDEEEDSDSSSREGSESASDEGNEYVEAVQDSYVNSLQDNRETDILSEEASSAPICLEVKDKNPIRSASTLPKDSDNVLCGQENKVHFLGLQETMTSKVDEFRIKELWNGKSGGIIAIWDTSCFSYIGTLEGDCFLAINGTWQSLQTPCLMIIVYVPQSQAKKTRLWSELPNLILDHDNLTIVMWDFNEVRSSSERMESVFNQNGALKFNEFIANTGGASAVTLCARLDQLDLLAKAGPLSPNNIKIRTIIVKDLMCLENQLIKDLKQKAKYKWAKDGDENSRFFHGINNSRLNRSRLNGLNFLGSWVTEPSLIKEHIFHVFENKFKETYLSRPTFSSNLFNHLSLEDNTFLDRPFSNKEIKDAVWGVVETKRLGQTGCNSSFITLIPKVDDPTVIGDFRPISLIGCQFMILAKVLANRLAQVISSVVSEIKACLNSAYASALINGFTSKEFKVERGLRQGDHLSPFLFILAVEALNVILVENKNKFHGIEVGKDKTYISHLQFADDTFIMGEWSLTNAKNLSGFLTCFHLASGLKVNFIKSKLFGVGVTLLEVNSIALSIDCQPSELTCIYLGLPAVENMSRCANWSPLIHRFVKRLSRWKSKTLSSGGHLTLIKFVLGGLGALSPLNQGGLGICSLKVSNQSMLIKWRWRFYKEDNALWGKFIHSIHGYNGGLGDLSSIKYKSGPWYRIVKLNDDLLPIRIDLKNIFKRKVGNGESTRFWLDNWVGGGPLNVSYPRLFRLEVNKNCLVRDRAPTVPQHHIVSFSSAATTTGPHTLGSMGPILQPVLHFYWTWSRPLRSQHEINEVNEIVSLLSNLYLSNSNDTWEYYLNHSHRFSVNLIRKHIILQSHNLSS